MDVDVCCNAARALRVVGGARPPVGPLIGALHDEDHTKRRKAVKILQALGDVRAVGPLIGALCDEDPYVRTAVVQALQELGDPRGEPLISALNNKELSERLESVKAFRACQDPVLQAWAARISTSLDIRAPRPEWEALSRNHASNPR
jgi:HEAT repeat protein